MKSWLTLILFIAVSQAQASTGVSCLLKTQVISNVMQPFMQNMGRVRVLELKNDTQNRNDFPCTQHFKKGLTLLVDLSHNDLKIAHMYTPGQIAHLNFVYLDDRSGHRSLSYELLSEAEYLQRQGR